MGKTYWTQLACIAVLSCYAAAGATSGAYVL